MYVYVLMYTFPLQEDLLLCPIGWLLVHTHGNHPQATYQNKSCHHKRLFSLLCHDIFMMHFDVIS